MEEKKATKPRQGYERPILIKEKGMTFPSRIISLAGKRVVCKQCSSCHGCR